jgi:DNA-binding transcriptional MerR regulator
MRIGQVAAGAAVNVETVRYYERTGMLPVPARAVSGYRQYDVEAVKASRTRTSTRLVTRHSHLGHCR